MLASAAPALAGPPEDFKALTDEYWAFVMREFPTFASQLGIHDYDDRLGDISLAAEDRRAAQYGQYLARLEAIPDAGLSPADRDQQGDPGARPSGKHRGQSLRPADDAVHQPQRLAPEYRRPGRQSDVPHPRRLRQLSEAPRAVSGAQRRGAQDQHARLERGLYPAVRRLGRVRGNDLGGDPRRSDQVAALRAVRGGAAGDDLGGRLVRAAGAGEGADRRRFARRLCQASRLVHGQLQAQVQYRRSALRRCPAARRFTNIASATRRRPTAPPTTSTRSACARSSASAPRWRRSPRRPASPAARRSSPTCAPTPNITPRRPRN